MPTKLWDVHEAPWWRAPPERQREAYYMNLRVHYEMGAAEALAYLRKHATKLGLDHPGGFMGHLKEAIHANQVSST